MKVNYQFKDGVAFAYVISNGHVEGSIQIDTENPDDYLNKTLDFDGNWSIAPLIKYAFVDENGFIKEIRTTYFSSEVQNNPIMNEEVKNDWVWDGNNFNPPIFES